MRKSIMRQNDYIMLAGDIPRAGVQLHVSALSTREAYLQDDPGKVPTWMNSIF